MAYFSLQLCPEARAEKQVSFGRLCSILKEWATVLHEPHKEILCIQIYAGDELLQWELRLYRIKHRVVTDVQGFVVKSSWWAWHVRTLEEQKTEEEPPHNFPQGVEINVDNVFWYTTSIIRNYYADIVVDRYKRGEENQLRVEHALYDVYQFSGKEDGRFLIEQAEKEKKRTEIKLDHKK